MKLLIQCVVEELRKVIFQKKMRGIIPLGILVFTIFGTLTRSTLHFQSKHQSYRLFGKRQM